MGAGNVKEVYARWSHLPHAPFRLLCYMAVTAKDNDETPSFFQGQEACAMALGMPPDADTKARQVAFRQVRRHMEALVKEKAIERIRAASPHRNAEYALCLDPQRRSVNDRRDGGR